jgi:N-dimethylarginine dimethylaminohydrolase
MTNKELITKVRKQLQADIVIQISKRTMDLDTLFSIIEDHFEVLTTNLNEEECQSQQPS